MTPQWMNVLKGEKDACYHKVKSRYKKWPSAYASGALVQCRKVGASKWGESAKKSWEDTVKGGDNFSREKKEGLHGWFSRRGGDGQKGWVSCQSCEDDKEGTLIPFIFFGISFMVLRFSKISSPTTPSPLERPFVKTPFS